MNEPIRVLLADDHAVVLAGIRKFLEQTPDIEVVADADDGETACALVEKETPDVIVLDIQMPGKSGIQVTQWVQERYPDVGVLILTAFDDDPYVVAVLQAGADGYILKTAKPDQIAQAVRDVYAGKAAVSPELAPQLMAHVAGRQTYDPLTDRELEVLTLAGKGLTNKAIGIQLGISDRTVQGHLAKTFTKLNAHGRIKAVMRAISLGLIDAE